MKRIPLALSSLFVLSTLGCAAEDGDPAPPDERAAEAEPLEGAVYVIDLPADFDKDELHALAQFVEQQGRDVQRAKIMVEATAGGAQMKVEMWGSELPGDGFGRALHDAFPWVDPEAVHREDAPAQPSPARVHEGMDPEEIKALALEDPELAKQKIIESLRAQGVEGEVDVRVEVGEDGEPRIEVQVEAHEDEAADAGAP